MVSDEVKRLRQLVSLFIENMKAAKDLQALALNYSTALASLYSLEYVFEVDMGRYVDMVRYNYDLIVDSFNVSYAEILAKRASE